MPTADDILQEIRAKTAPQHARLEEAVDIGSRLQHPERYRELLELFLGWYEPMETRLNAVSGWGEYGLDPRSRAKASWLKQDLQALGLTSRQIEEIPRCNTVPDMDTLGRAFGCAYVVEGSTLGGRHIANMMQDSPIPLEARRFFSSYGSEVGQKWKEFLQALTEFASRTAQTEQIVSGAAEAFSSMQGWVEKVGAAAR